MIELDFSKPTLKPSSVEESHLVIDALSAFCGNLHKELELLKQEVIALKKENAELKERLNTNSNNSSKPPSTNSKKNNGKKNYKGSGRHPGGQPGHKGVFRKLTSDSPHLVIAKKLSFEVKSESRRKIYRDCAAAPPFWENAALAV